MFESLAVDDGAQGGGAAGGDDAFVEESCGEFFLADERVSLVGKLLRAFDFELRFDTGIIGTAVNKLATNQSGAVFAAEAVDDFVDSFGDIEAGSFGQAVEHGGELGPSGNLAQIVDTDANECRCTSGNQRCQRGIDTLVGGFALASGQAKRSQQGGAP